MKMIVLVGLIFMTLVILIYNIITTYLASRLKTNDYFYKLIAKEFWLIRILDRQLKNADYWISLNQAIGVHIIIVAAVLSLAAKNYTILKQLQTGVVFLIVFESLFFLENHLQIKKRNERIMLDLCELQDTLRYQSGTGVEDSVILQAIFSKLKDRMFRKCIQDIVLAYSTNQDVVEKIEALKTISNNSNLIIFSNTLLQKHRIGQNEGNIDAQATNLRRFASNIETIKRKERHIKLVGLSLILGVMYLILLVVPLIMKATEDLERLLN